MRIAIVVVPAGNGLLTQHPADSSTSVSQSTRHAGQRPYLSFALCRFFLFSGDEQCASASVNLMAPFPFLLTKESSKSRAMPRPTRPQHKNEPAGPLRHRTHRV
ncbi:hypothetical protein EVAR_33528_1 [Eumeta japonica]|uniref:Uncharacterized protein n=1 Tax=Eumeta variegata TaxID=151549 RepID=A0A4C1VJL8_EUMVA|nr:hypothetical protein EVAR_33528_1 [Eumeta japonica]